MTPEEWRKVKEVLQTALELEPEARQTFLDNECAGQISVRREVESLLKSEEQDEPFLEQPAVIDAAELVTDASAWVGRRLGPYQLLEKIGEGGMGDVYRAVRADGMYDKQVAIKLIHSGLSTDFFLSRFRNERQILAALEHPNIARLLDGGVAENGMPYVVLEFVAGVPIDEYCARHDLPITDRLNLFRTVCSAVQYAHRNLVVHRDLKPGNILVTEDGTPKLLDFGIAKILNPKQEQSGGDRTLTVMRIMTPDFASPEQVRGDPITTSSDVYSLGVILYLLLTGRGPYHVSSTAPHEIIKAICDTDPERPSTAVGRAEKPEKAIKSDSAAGVSVGTEPKAKREKLTRELAGDLDNIVLKALRKEPERRYTTVEQFSEDVRRHLENLPVIARKDTPGYRASKFVLRHKVGVAAAAIFSVLLSGALGFALREARIARANELRAERRFNDVRALANSLIFEIHDGIRDLPGSTPVRKLLVERAVGYLDGLSREATGDQSLQRELAEAYTRIGEVQGSPFSPNLGDPTDALKSYAKALVIWQSLYSSQSAKLEDAIGLAKCFRLLSNIQIVNAEPAAALENSRRAVQTSEQAMTGNPNSLQLLIELQRDYETEADLLASSIVASHLGNAASASPLRQKQLDVAKELVALRPDSPDLQLILGASILSMGDQLAFEGRRREAAECYLRAQTTLTNLTLQSPNNSSLSHHLHDAYYALKNIQLADGNVQQALGSARNALEIAKKLNLSDPLNTQFSLALAADYDYLGDALSLLGREEEALKASERSIAIVTDLVRRNPRNPEFRTVKAVRLLCVAEVYRRAADYARALRYNRDATAIFEAMQSRDPANAGARFHIAWACNRAGAVLIRQRDLEGAASMYNRALALVLPEASTSHPAEDELYLMADSYAGLGEINVIRASDNRESPQDRIAHWDQARLSYESSMSIWSRIKEPGRVSPYGFECVPPASVGRELARSKKALVRLGMRD